MVGRAGTQRGRIRAGWLAASVVAALVGAGCGSSSTASPDEPATISSGEPSTSSTRQPSTTLAAVVLDPTQLAGALLSGGDLPSGWSVVDSPFPGSLGGSSLTCPEALGVVQADTRKGATRTFSYADRGSGLSPVLGQALASAPGADATMAAIRAGFEGCVRSTSDTAAGTAGPGSLVEVAAPTGAGEEAFAYRQTTSRPVGGTSVNVTIDAVVVRSGATVEVYLLTTTGGSGASTSEQFASIVDAGDAKVVKAMG